MFFDYLKLLVIKLIYTPHSFIPLKLPWVKSLRRRLRVKRPEFYRFSRLRLIPGAMTRAFWGRKGGREEGHFAMLAGGRHLAEVAAAVRERVVLLVHQGRQAGAESLELLLLWTAFQHGRPGADHRHYTPTHTHFQEMPAPENCWPYIPRGGRGCMDVWVYSTQRSRLHMYMWANINNNLKLLNSIRETNWSFDSCSCYTRF